MTIIKVTCPCCGDVELANDAVTLTIHPVKERSTYSFTCPTCRDEVRKTASAEVIRLLKMGQVAIVKINEMPAEAMERENFPPGGTLITHDEVLDFANWLTHATIIAAAAAAGLYPMTNGLQIDTEHSSCDYTEFDPRSIQLVECTVEAWSYSSFTCRTCNKEVRKPHESEVADLSTSGGVIAERWDVPTEALDDARHNKDTEPLSLDLLIGFGDVDLAKIVSLAEAEGARRESDSQS